MAWKNLKQLGLVDGFLIEHKALTEIIRKSCFRRIWVELCLTAWK
uniref:Uncharacterized protein n=1 Tax=Candidatus Kentrum sp. UNK TaxID=2126344 RepID=A0A451AFQ6_9GAMM|nr:MAG: hypothetical protein BECKUNK1418G_GA0071005_105317 [Candidatus Kentron sp. UNK]VFK71269.1 MAG: hypothetical protein BECKUNK1418H_GA0071006_10586 [Candidatus Kentron sp. UNK]